MKLLNIPVEIEKYQKAVNKSPNNMAWLEWLDSVFTSRTGLPSPRTTVRGITELTTNAEARTGTDPVRTVTPRGTCEAIRMSNTARIPTGNDNE